MNKYINLATHLSMDLKFTAWTKLLKLTQIKLLLTIHTLHNLQKHVKFSRVFVARVKPLGEVILLIEYDDERQVEDFMNIKFKLFRIGCKLGK
jgi:hypothetical protein